MQTMNITKVYWGSVNINGSEVPKIGIKTDAYGDKWLSCLENKQNSRGLRALQEGQSAEIIVEQNNDFLNFRLPTGFDYLKQRVERLEATVYGTGSAQNDNPPEQTTNVANTNVPYPDGAATGAAEDLPF